MSLLVTYVLLALCFSFFCSIAEAVLLSVTPPYIASLEKKKPATGRLLRRLKDEVNRPLAAILTLNTIAHTVGAAGAGAQAAAVFGNQYVGLASAILTLMILIFSEIIPKSLGAHYWRQLAPVMGRLLRYLVILLYPFVVLSELLTRGMTYPPGQRFSREEFAAMADLGAREGQLEAKESRILKNLFRFRSSILKNIMTPRTVVFALQEETSIETFLQNHRQTPFSRIPIYGRDRDDITGFVLKSDILLAQAQGRTDARLKDFQREISAVASTMTLSEVFEYLLDRREHIVLVVDEYGGMEGIVTLEDVVETLLGLEIVDEADETVDMQALARALWEKRARYMGLIIEDARRAEAASDPEAETDAPPEESDGAKADDADEPDEAVDAPAPDQPDKPQPSPHEQTQSAEDSSHDTSDDLK